MTSVSDVFPAMMANTVHWVVATEQSPEDVFLVVAPLFHAAGSVAVLATVWLGGRQVILPALDRRRADV